ncbi:MAG: hypothetical protein MJY67_08825, partial [Bacteroidales bacterium]|nr:hypothetical protein [Bacteroidales bacterium]
GADPRVDALIREVESLGNEISSVENMLSEKADTGDLASLWESLGALSSKVDELYEDYLTANSLL